jgi:hypothetical protein
MIPNQTPTPGVYDLPYGFPGTMPPAKEVYIGNALIATSSEIKDRDGNMATVMAHQACQQCFGNGWVTQKMGMFNLQIPCVDCNPHICEHCLGTGHYRMKENKECHHCPAGDEMIVVKRKDHKDRKERRKRSKERGGGRRGRSKKKEHHRHRSNSGKKEEKHREKQDKKDRKEFEK